jgi:hypothetical protein
MGHWRAGQIDQPCVLPVFGIPTLGTKSDGATSTTSSAPGHININSPSQNKFPFTFYFPEHTHNAKDIAIPQALLPKMLPFPRLYGLSDARLANTIPTARANASRRHGSSVDQYVAPQDPSTVFDNYRRNQVSRFSDSLRAHTSVHVQQCQYCQSKRFSDPECSVRRAMSGMPADARQTPRYSFTPLPQGEDGAELMPQLSLDADPSHDMAPASYLSSPHSPLTSLPFTHLPTTSSSNFLFSFLTPPVKIHGNTADTGDASLSYSAINHEDLTLLSQVSNIHTTATGEPSQSEPPVDLEDTPIRSPTPQSPHVGDGYEAQPANTSSSSSASSSYMPAINPVAEAYSLNTGEDYGVGKSEDLSHPIRPSAMLLRPEYNTRMANDLTRPLGTGLSRSSDYIGLPYSYPSPAMSMPAVNQLGQTYEINVVFHPKNVAKIPAQEIDVMHPTDEPIDESVREHTSPAVPVSGRSVPAFNHPQGMPFPGQNTLRYTAPSAQPTSGDEEYEFVPPNHESGNVNGEEFEMVSENFGAGAPEYEDDSEDTWERDSEDTWERASGDEDE